MFTDNIAHPVFCTLFSFPPIVSIPSFFFFQSDETKSLLFFFFLLTGFAPRPEGAAFVRDLWRFEADSGDRRRRRHNSQGLRRRHQRLLPRGDRQVLLAGILGTIARESRTVSTHRMNWQDRMEVRKFEKKNNTVFIIDNIQMIYRHVQMSL